jgi:hypothetical protein
MCFSPTEGFHGPRFESTVVTAVWDGFTVSRVQAATTTLDVDTPLDSPAAQYQACTTAPNDCSLAGAVARTYGTASDWIINVPAGTYVLTQTGALEIMNSGSIVINGAGQEQTILDGNDAERVFYVNVAEDLVINDLTIANGHAPDGPLNNSNGGAIRNLAGNLTLNNCTFRDNRAGDDSPSRIGGHGGALMIEANYTVLNNCIFQNNRAGDSTEGTRGGDGGALYIQNGFVTLEGCTFTENYAGDGSYDPAGDGGRGGWGGAVFVYLGTLDITRTTFIANQAGMGAAGSENGGLGGWGGAILNNKGGLSIYQSTFVGNRAGDGGDGAISGGNGGSGGAIVNYEVSTFLKHSTVRGNAAGNGGAGGTGRAGYGGFGGGLENYAGTLGVINSTISGNVTGEAGGGGTGNHSGYGGGLDNYHGTVKLANVTLVENQTGSYRGYGGGINNEGEFIFKNTIVANNTASATGPDCATMTALHSYGYNLVEDTTFCTLDNDGGAGTVTGNIYGQDPQLAALGAYGGPTETHEPQSGSPVVDAGNPSGCTDTKGAPLIADQRGFSRPIAGGTGQAACDIGAVELQPKARLLVNLRGAGQVTDNTGTLDCSSDCSVGYAIGTNVALTVTTVGGWAFDGWDGACSGSGTCALTMDQDLTVTALFSAEHHVYLPLVLRMAAP